MSSTVTVVCDKCSNVIVSGRTLLSASAGPLRQRRHSIDLCESCLTSFESWLGGNGHGQAADPVSERIARHPAASADGEPSRPRNTGRQGRGKSEAK